MTIYLLDNSVVQRLDRVPMVAAAVRELGSHGDVLAVSDVSILEAGHSATSSGSHAEIMRVLGDDLFRLPLSAEVGPIGKELQSALFAAGIGRAAGVVDLLHAATAIVHDAVVVHYDADFELLAGADHRLMHQWIVPRGSVD